MAKLNKIAAAAAACLLLQSCSEPTRIDAMPAALAPVLPAPASGELAGLQAVPGLGNWTGFQGDAAHTGFVAARFNAARFSSRWQRAAPGGYAQPFNSAAHENGMVFITVNGANSAASELLAIDEASGNISWRANLGSSGHVNPPAAAHGQVYVTTTGRGDSSYRVFDQRSGVMLSKVATQSEWEGHRAPTVAGSDVYAEGGFYGGLSKFNAATRREAWWSTTPQYHGWAPSVDAQHAYGFLAGQLTAVGVADGAPAWSAADPDDKFSDYTGATVTLSDQQMGFVANDGRLVAFDLARRRHAWSVRGHAMGQPAYGNGTVYVLNGRNKTLEARAPANGALLWDSAALGAGTFDRLIVARNLAFASSRERTVAVDLATRKVVWSHPHGGDLSVSQRGVLYILADNGALAAVNLH